MFTVVLYIFYDIISPTNPISELFCSIYLVFLTHLDCAGVVVLEKGDGVRTNTFRELSQNNSAGW